MKTFEEAADFAKRMREDSNIMLNEKTGEYHVIRLFGVDHWKQHLKTVAEVRVIMDIKHY